MKYPDRLFIELPKRVKTKKGQKARHFDFITKNFNLNTVKISQVPHDPRSGVDYRVVDIKDYQESIDLGLIRCDQLE